MFFPIVTYRCERWTIKKAERQRIVAFELWYWRRLLRVLWTARRSNQSNKNSAQISPYMNLTQITGPTLGGQKPKGRNNSILKPGKRKPQTQ